MLHSMFFRARALIAAASLAAAGAVQGDVVIGQVAPLSGVLPTTVRHSPDIRVGSRFAEATVIGASGKLPK